MYMRNWALKELQFIVIHGKTSWESYSQRLIMNWPKVIFVILRTDNFRYVNRRFCGAVHSVDRACISVLPQVVIFYRFMKRKTVQTKYDVPVRRTFRWASEQQSCSAEASMIVGIPAPWLTKKIIFVCTVFLSFTLRMTCERTLIHAQFTLWIAPQNLHFTLWDEYLQGNIKTQSASSK